MNWLKAFRVVGLIGLVLAVTAAVSSGVRVRLEVLALKLQGGLPEISKWDVLPLFKPHSGFDLPALVETRSPYSSLQLPPQREAEAALGASIFAGRCASCHGPEAQGGMGPALASTDLRHGASDWAMFRVVRDGVPGTAMQPLGLSFDDTWRVIARIRELQRGEMRAEGAAIREEPSPVSEAEIATAGERDDDWVTYAGGWNGHRNKRVPELTAASVPSLSLAWAYQLKGDPPVSQSTPIATRGLLIVTDAEHVVALSQATGQVVWRYYRELPKALKLCCVRANRGAAVFGSLLYFGTLDAHLIALDLTTGRMRWDVKVADANDGASITGAPLIADGRLIIGISGSEFGVRAFIDAYNPSNGERLWRFYTIPDLGEPGRDSWPVKHAARGGGGGAWVTGAYDPKLKLLYWGTGNPSPAYAADARVGNNLYTCSVLALDIETGKLRWTYQFTPNDSHDWDSGQTPILTDRVWNGEMRPLMLWANKNGFFYVLDRRTGEFLRATAFARQNWNDGFDLAGRPKVRPEVTPTEKGVMVYPGNAGATNWWPSTYSESLGLMFVPVWDGGGWYFRDPALDRSDGLFAGGRVLPVPGERVGHFVAALDVASGQIKWQAPLATLPHGAKSAGLLSIGDRLVFGAEENVLVAFDARTGRRIWDQNLGAEVGGAPIVFRVNSRPHLAVTAGSELFVFGLGREAAVAERSQGVPAGTAGR